MTDTSTLRRYLVLAPPLLVVLISGCVLLHDLPPSPASRLVQPVVRRVVDPLLDQSWQLFAPNPPEANMDVWVQVKYADGAPDAPPPVYQLSQAYINRVKTTGIPFVPARFDRVATSIGHALVRIAVEEAKLKQMPPQTTSGETGADDLQASADPSTATAHQEPPQQRQLEDVVRRQRFDIFGQSQRVGSLTADSVSGGHPISMVRVFVTSTPIPTSAAVAPVAKASVTRIGDSGWLTYVPDMENSR